MQPTGRIGKYIKSSATKEEYYTYIPSSLPFSPPPLLTTLYPLLDRASTALGRLDGMSLALPDPSLFLYMYIRKEAVLSSQIEGTQSSLSDLLLFENEQSPGIMTHDVVEVSCYVSALQHGLQRLKQLPLSLRLLREIHEKLMDHPQGRSKQPGEFRRSQNWIGGSRPGNAQFVPPPVDELMSCLDNFEKFLHDDHTELPILVKAAIAHVQFETIHPFLDGNGRLGRLLITFMLCAQRILKEPLLYLSLYLKTHRQRYYDLLQSVREKGNWEEWIEFFLTAVIETADQAIEAARAIMHLFAKDANVIQTFGKSTAGVLTVFQHLHRQPITNTTLIRQNCGISLPTALRSLNFLESKGIVKEITGRGRHKIFIYQEYMDILSQGTEPIK